MPCLLKLVRFVMLRVAVAWMLGMASAGKADKAGAAAAIEGARGDIFYVSPHAVVRFAPPSLQV